jgi:hypothetical protein
MENADQANRKAFRIPISTGIFEHTKRLGKAVYLFMYYIDRTTGEVYHNDGSTTGTVLGGSVCNDADAASTLGVSIDAIGRWRRKLVECQYIRQVRASNGYRIEVLKSKRSWKQYFKNVVNHGRDVIKPQIRYRTTADQIPHNRRSDTAQPQITSPQSLDSARVAGPTLQGLYSDTTDTSPSQAFAHTKPEAESQSERWRADRKRGDAETFAHAQRQLQEQAKWMREGRCAYCGGERLPDSLVCGDCALRQSGAA